MAIIQPQPMSAEKQAMFDNLDILNGLNNSGGYTYGREGSIAYGTSEGSGLTQAINDKLNKGEDITGLTQQFAQGAQAYVDNLNKPKTVTKANPLDGFKSYADQLKAAQLQAQMAALGKARDSSLSNLTNERGKIQPLYYGKRNETSTGSQLQAKNFAEYMAQRGQSNSGASGQAELSRNVALQGNIGRLNQDEANAFINNDRMVTDTNNAYESDVASANANIEAQAMQNLMDFYRENLAREQDQANIDRNFNYQIGRDSVSDNRYNQQWDYNVGRDTIEDTRYDQNYQQQLAQQQLDNEYRAKQAEIDNLYRQGQMSLQERQMKLSEAEFKFQQEQAKIDNQYRAQTKSSGGSNTSGSSLNKAQAKNELFMEMDSYIKGGEYERGKEILEQDKAAIIATFGQTTYNQLYNKFWDSQAY